MNSCTFFGHRDTKSYQIEKSIIAIITDLITNHDVNNFYVGNNGSYDKAVYKILYELKKSIFPKINIYLVLAYLPKKDEFDLTDYSNSIYPEGIEKVPPRFAIEYRNKFMIENSKYVITYVKRQTGGASKFKELALKKQKTVIEISNL